MNYLNYYSHLLLHSKYKLVLYLMFYVLLLICYKTNTHSIYCIGEVQSSVTNKYFGMSLFLGSVALMLFIQKFSTGGSDPSALFDMTMHLHNQGTLQNAPEFLDYFTLTKEGQLNINGLNIHTNALYLNADEVIRQIQLEDKYKNILTETFNRLCVFYNKYEIPIQGMNNMEQILPAHLEHMNNLMGSFVLQTLNLSYHANFINALERAGILNPSYILWLNEFITSGGQPDQFYNFLVYKLQTRS